MRGSAGFPSLSQAAHLYVAMTYPVSLDLAFVHEGRARGQVHLRVLLAAEEMQPELKKQGPDFKTCCNQDKPVLLNKWPS